MGNIPQDLIGTRQAAEKLGVSHSTIRSWLKRGRLVRWRRGDGRVLVRESEVERLKADLQRVERIDPPATTLRLEA